MRGKPEPTVLGIVLIGITPACAGKTSCRTTHRISCRDHPRVCGENRQRHRRACRGAGSPPRVRGKQECFMREACWGRITPACAGKTKLNRIVYSLIKDHPRVCGENKQTGIFRKQKRGSPPRVRGKPAFNLTASSNVRITPACAGKTLSGSSWRFSPRDHPRVCGENP